jgi:hypothetical protein
MPASSESPDEPPAAHVESSAGIQVGSRNQQSIHYHGEAAEPSWPVRVGTVPVVADCYQNRDVALAVEEGLDTAGTVVLVPAATTVMAGMGGVGKTQIAARHVRPLWTNPAVDLAVWVTAADRDAIIASYARTAHAIGRTHDEDPVIAAQTLLNWLTTTDRRWVVVLDDVQDPRHVDGMWPPHTDSGHTVVTTRRRDAALQRTDRRIVEVSPYTIDESSAYLRAKLAALPHLLDGAAELADELGQLPLALAQAVAFVQDLEITCRDYTRRFRAGRPVAPDALPDEHQYTVDRIWALSIERADALAPAGITRPLLELLSYLDPNGPPHRGAYHRRRSVVSRRPLRPTNHRRGLPACNAGPSQAQSGHCRPRTSRPRSPCPCPGPTCHPHYRFCHHRIRDRDRRCKRAI